MIVLLQKLHSNRATYVTCHTCYEYFLANAGLSFKQYVLEYRIKSAETRLRYSNLTLSQIADELGFTDISHLNKTYKNLRGIYPREVRKRN